MVVSAILAARHRTFVLVITSLFVLFVFPMHNKFLLLLQNITLKESFAASELRSPEAHKLYKQTNTSLLLTDYNSLQLSTWAISESEWRSTSVLL